MLHRSCMNTALSNKYYCISFQAVFRISLKTDTGFNLATLAKPCHENEAGLFSKVNISENDT